MAAEDRQRQALDRTLRQLDTKPGVIPGGPIAREQTLERARRERRSGTRERRPRKVPARRRPVRPPRHHPPGQPAGFIQQVSP
jgi:hypothetical protein